MDNPKVLKENVVIVLDMLRPDHKEGFVKNPTVIDSNAPGIFDQPALDAALKYRYLPMIVSGVPVDVPGVKTRITFEMADN